MKNPESNKIASDQIINLKHFSFSKGNPKISHVWFLFLNAQVL